MLTGRIPHLNLCFGNPFVFQKYKYPSIEERMGTLLRNREEALTAHELARNHMIEQRKSAFVEVISKYSKFILKFMV